MTKPRVLVWEDAAGIIRWNKPHSHIYFKREIARIPTDIEEGFRRHHPLTEELLIVGSSCGRENHSSWRVGQLVCYPCSIGGPYTHTHMGSVN